jgi:integrase/recombinase XerC
VIQRLFQRLRRSAPEPSARAVRDDWLEWLRLSGFAELTIKGYRLTTDRLLTRWPEIAFSEFNDDHILGVIEESKPASRQARRSAFQNWFQWGVRTKRIERDPMRHVPTYKPAPRDPIVVFTSAECKVLCSLPEPDGTLMAVLLGAGLRKAEARNLTVKRVDLENGEIQVVEGAKGRTAGIVPIEQKLVQRLAEYFLVEGLDCDDYLWYCRPGGHATRRHDRALVDASMHQWWARCIEAAVIPYKNMHVTRHTFATEWRRRGLALDDVGLLLRHADSRTTERVYIHTKLIDVRKRMEALA